MYPAGMLSPIEQPWGFDGVRREARSAFADSRNFYVNPNHVEATDDNSGEDPAHPLVTVQAAIGKARAASGDVIYVTTNDGWQFGQQTQNPIQESVVVPANKPGLTIVGVGSGAMGVTWMPGAADEVCLTTYALDTVIQGFNFWAPNGGDGIACIWAAPVTYGENTIIRNCTFAAVDMGVYLEYAWYVVIERCYFDECDEYGVYSDPAKSNIAKCQIVGNWFQDCAAAITVAEAEECLIAGNFIYNVNAQGAAVATNEGIDTSSGARNIVANNYFSCLLPVPANGDYDDLNSASATDAWVGNHCMNGLAITNPT